MDVTKSLDELELIASVLRDVCVNHVRIFDTQACECTIKTVRSRTETEGLGFLTKSLPRIGKALDQALSFSQPFPGLLLLA